MRTITRTTTKPWCTCMWDKQDGWSFRPKTGKWVHPICGKPSRACS